MLGIWAGVRAKPVLHVATQYGHNMSNNSNIAQLVPIGSVCQGCKQPILKPTEWRMSVFGDAICKFCLSQERIKYPDLYADPELISNAAAKVAQAIERDEKINTRKEHRQHIAGPSFHAGIVCECGKNSSLHQIRKHWVWDQHKQVWTCAECFYSRCRDYAQFSHGQFLEDRYRRVFQVFKLDDVAAWAVYPFGTTKIPELYIDSPTACQTVFDFQSAAMFDNVTEYFHVFNSILERAKKFIQAHGTLPPYNDDDIYDTALTTYMKCCTLLNPARPVRSFLAMSIERNINKELRKRRRAYRSTQLIEADERIAVDVETADTEADRREIMYQVLDQCRVLMGDNWDLFYQWVVENRTQTDIGIPLGVIGNTIGMRFKKSIGQCRDSIPYYHGAT